MNTSSWPYYVPISSDWPKPLNLTISEIQKLTPEQVSKLNYLRTNFYTSEQIAAFLPEQIPYIQPHVIAGFTNEQVSGFTESQKEKFSSMQLHAYRQVTIPGFEEASKRNSICICKM